MSINDFAGAFVNAIKQTLTPSTPPTSQSVPSRDTAAPSEPEVKKTLYNPPSLFESLRRDPQKKRRFNNKKLKEKTKLIHYVRDVILLPRDMKGPNNSVSIPRSKRRSMLAQAGLVGKIELNSGMDEVDVCKEVCEVFCQPMGLTADDLKKSNYFKFVYLQRAGAGSRTLCVASVKGSFQWNGKQVATLAKSGSVIYLLAQDNLPGWNIKVWYAACL